MVTYLKHAVVFMNFMQNKQILVESNKFDACFDMYLQDHPLYKDLAAKFPAFFYSVLTVSGKFQHGWVVGAEGRQESGFKFFKRKV